MTCCFVGFGRRNDDIRWAEELKGYYEIVAPVMKTALFPLDELWYRMVPESFLVLCFLNIDSSNEGSSALDAEAKVCFSGA